MNTPKYFFSLFLIFVAFGIKAQVKTNFNNQTVITAEGRFTRPYKTIIDFQLEAQNISMLVETEKKDLPKNGTKPFQLAVPLAVDLDISKLMIWNYDKEYAYGKYIVEVSGALSASINFDKFYLPQGTEMYVYNKNGNMITGPITENENNENKIWGSWVYKGELLIIEVKTPLVTKNKLELHANNVAYGYKEIYKFDRAAGFGQSDGCNINVICPLGIGWEQERNSIALVLNDNGSRWCSGAMVMNACGTTKPFFLTADHCFTGRNVSAWRFIFQYWSSICSNPGKMD